MCRSGLPSGKPDALMLKLTCFSILSHSLNQLKQTCNTMQWLEPLLPSREEQSARGSSGSVSLTAVGSSSSISDHSLSEL